MPVGFGGLILLFCGDKIEVLAYLCEAFKTERVVSVASVERLRKSASYSEQFFLHGTISRFVLSYKNAYISVLSHRCFNAARAIIGIYGDYKRIRLIRRYTKTLCVAEIQSRRSRAEKNYVPAVFDIKAYSVLGKQL